MFAIQKAFWFQKILFRPRLLGSLPFYIYFLFVPVLHFTLQLQSHIFFYSFHSERKSFLGALPPPPPPTINDVPSHPTFNIIFALAVNLSPVSKKYGIQVFRNKRMKWDQEIDFNLAQRVRKIIELTENWAKRAEEEEGEGGLCSNNHERSLCCCPFQPVACLWR